MIVANLATYPQRERNIAGAVGRLAPQVDRLNVVLNEFGSIPQSAPRAGNVSYVLPHEDTKDAGKFYPDTAGANLVLIVDDDVVYPPDYAERTARTFHALGDGRFLGGYHCSIYERPGLPRSLADLRKTVRFHTSRRRIARFRRYVGFVHQVDAPILVDQVATNAAVMRADDIPPYEYMRSSQKFVDVRLAKWCFERGIERVRLPAPAGWLRDEAADGSIASSFTQKHHPHVAEEIWSYAFMSPRRGEAPADLPARRG